MAVLDIEDSKFNGALADQVQEWAAGALSSYFERHPTNPHRESKQIHDPVGGVIDARPWELYVLDSPLMQRLRYIRQLGVGQVLFPTSAYSRFEHSLGSMHMAASMFDAIVDAQEEAGQPIYSVEEFRWRRSVVRLAALVHDIGHCMFSHVSEKFYRRYPPLIEAMNFFSKYFATKISASEGISLLILQAPAFIDLLQRARVAKFIGREEEEVAFQVRACVAGSKIRLKPDAFMAEIVNGSVDCDKLDYLARDAHTAGVPIALDTRRLLSKLRLAEVEEAGHELHALAIVPSGTRALDELLVTRIFLYDKFYYHPKLMAAEEVVRSALRWLSHADARLKNPVSLLDLADDAFLHLTEKDAASKFGVQAGDAEVKRAVELLRRARLRDLPRRAFAFALRFMPPRLPIIAAFETPGIAEDSATDAQVDFRQFGRELEDPAMLDRITGEIEAFVRELGVKGDIFVAHQVARRAGSPTYLPVVLPNGKLEQAPSFLFKSHEWTEAYALNKATSFVFAYDDLPKVHIAVERMLTDVRGLPRFAPSCWMMAKMDVDEIELERKRLPPGWVDFRLRPDYLETEEAQERLRALRTKYASCLHAFDPDQGPSLVEGWVSQFPTSDLQDSALRLLEHITYVEPSRIVDGFGRFIERDDSLTRGIWVPFLPRNEAGKSADQMTVDLRELRVKKKKIGELDAAQILAAGHIVFFDDSINTGTQAVSLLRSWFDMPSGQDDADSDRDSAPLPEEVREALKKVWITFLYYASHPRGEAHLVATANSMGIGKSDVRVSSVIDSQNPVYTLDSLTCPSAESKRAFFDYMKGKGSELLEARVKTKGWPSTRPAEFALGFGGLHVTIAFRHSISTATPAVLWEMQNGPINYWLPIFPRRRKELRDAVPPRTRQTPLHELPEYQQG